MPVLNFDLSHDGRPIVELYVSVPSVEREACYEEGRTVPPAILIRALVDTGAGRSHIDLDVLERLAILRAAVGLVFTASGGPAEPRGIYLVDLALAGDEPGPLAIDLEVFGSPIAGGLQAEALLGRDILAKGALFYDGIGRRFTLALNPPSQA